jgi:hypothetical protein
MHGQGNPAELERAQAVDDLLRRAYHGPPDNTGTEDAGETGAPRRGGWRQLSAILSGAAGTGKTTAITQLGKTHEATDRARHPGQERIPVIYVTVPPARGLRTEQQVESELGSGAHNVTVTTRNPDRRHHVMSDSRQHERRQVGMLEA